jgi:Ras-related protein Rab-1A
MASKHTDYDYLVKIVFIGDSGVGKSSLLLKYVDDVFTGGYISTIGVDFRINTLVVDDKVFKLQIWDTAGQERFKSITTAYYRGANSIVMIYDITDKESFANIKKWKNELERYAESGVHLVLVGNKSDLESNRAVSISEAKEYARIIECEYVETSAKTGAGIDKIFVETCKSVRIKYDSIVMMHKTPIDKDNSDRSNKCCY